MKNTNYSFSTELVDGSNFRIYQKISGILFFLFLATGIISNFIFDDKDIPVWDKLTSPLSIFYFVAIAALCLIYFYLRKKRVAGKIRIGNGVIEVDQEDKRTFDISNLDQIEIQRGATHHYSHDINNEIVNVNNYLRFIENKKPYTFEFTIDSKQKNAEFEELIQTLQKSKIKLHYTSI